MKTYIIQNKGKGTLSIVQEDLVKISGSTSSNGNTLTLEQARQNGNILEGDVEMSSGTGLTRYADNRTGSSIYFNDEFLSLSSFSGVDHPTQRNISITLDPIEEKALKLNILPGVDSKGIIGSEEFNKQGDRKAFAQLSDVEDSFTRNQDIEITDATKGIILKSPNGNRFRVTINDGGVLTTTAL